MVLLNLPILKKGNFYYIKESDSDFVLEDKTKRGLEIRNHSIDEKTSVQADKGMIHDMDGIGHLVVIRWFFPKSDFDLDKIVVFANEMEEKYTKLRELTCPDDDDDDDDDDTEQQ